MTTYSTVFGRTLGPPPEETLSKTDASCQKIAGYRYLLDANTLSDFIRNPNGSTRGSPW
jgi:hypothetical protein